LEGAALERSQKAFSYPLTHKLEMKKRSGYTASHFDLSFGAMMFGLILCIGFVSLTTGQQIAPPSQGDPCAMFRIPGAGSLGLSCLPVKIIVSNVQKEKVLDSYCDPPGVLPCNRKDFVKYDFVFDYEAEGAGTLIYKKDFSEFHVQVRGTPAQTRIVRAEGYTQWYTLEGIRSQKKWHKKNIPAGPVTVRRPMSVVFNYPAGEEGRTVVHYAPVEVETPDDEMPTHSGSQIGSEYNEPEPMVITPQVMKQIMEGGGFNKTFQWRFSDPDGKRYTDNLLNIRMEIGEAKPEKSGGLSVSPGDGLISYGPDEKGAFEPSSKTYTLNNTGDSSINYTVSKSAAWLNLSGTQGSLGPQGSASLTVSIEESQARNMKEGTYKDTVTFTNTTNGKGNTSRPAELTAGEEQEWEVKLTGQETDDLGGALMYLKLEEAWKMITVDYGVRFDYTVLARFKIKKEKGVWKYKSGTIIDAKLGFSSNFNPDVFIIKKINCLNCQDVPGLIGSSLLGDVYEKTVTLYWPRVITRVIVSNKLKLQFESKDKSHQGWSDNYFESAEFFDRAHEHILPLKNDAILFNVTKKSAQQRYKLDKRKPITISYRYLLKRIR
jgi:hypothetical protein